MTWQPTVVDEDAALIVRSKPHPTEAGTTVWEITGLYETVVDLQVLRLQNAEGVIDYKFKVPHRLYIDGVCWWRSVGYTIEARQ